MLPCIVFLFSLSIRVCRYYQTHTDHDTGKKYVDVAYLTKH